MYIPGVARPDLVNVGQHVNVWRPERGGALCAFVHEQQREGDVLAHLVWNHAHAQDLLRLELGHDQLERDLRRG